MNAWLALAWVLVGVGIGWVACAAWFLIADHRLTRAEQVATAKRRHPSGRDLNNGR